VLAGGGDGPLAQVEADGALERVVEDGCGCCRRLLFVGAGLVVAALFFAGGGGFVCWFLGVSLWLCNG
jgi:hypothetical protein